MIAAGCYPAKERASCRMGNKVFEYPIYYDYEDPSQSNINGTKAGQICHAFMDTLRDNGYLVGLYSMASWINQDWVTTSGLRDTYEGWIAILPTMENNTGITSDLYWHYFDTYSTRYGMHQYSFTTYVNGQGPFDCNVSFKDYPAIVKKYGFNGYGSTETWIEKACFDVMVYRDRNPDIAHYSDAQLKEHWLKYGIKEGRASSTVLDLGFYANNNPDVKAAFTVDGKVDYEKIYNHFITSGYKEKRKSSALFDGAYYCERYPEVEASFKEEYLRHYVENGIHEDRRPSLTFDPNYYWFIRPDVKQAWPNDYQMCARHYAGHGIMEQTEAYDHEHPVISDVVVSDISAAGYTVTCTVTDNWGLSRVSFPTWTVLNDQDDLAADFMNTQQGTKSGNTYTFRVNASDHNKEGGQYVTHIYAKDKGGNTTQYVLDTVDVKDVPITQITLIADSQYMRSVDKVLDVTAGTTATTFLKQFRNEVLELRDANGNVISGSAKIGTGTKVNLYNSGTLVDSVTVVVTGDVNGDGLVNIADCNAVRSVFLHKLTLSPYQQAAADVDGNGTVNANDYARIKAHIQGGYNLYQ